MAATAAVAAPPAAPTGAVAYVPGVDISADQNTTTRFVHFSWIDNSSDEETFRIQYRETGSSAWITIGETVGPNFEVVRLSTSDGQNLDLRVAAVRGSEVSSYSQASVILPSQEFFLGEFEGIGGIEGEPYEYFIQYTGSPDSFFIDGFPAGTTVDPSTGKISGNFPAAGVHRVFYGAVVNGQTFKQVLYLRVVTVTPGPKVVNPMSTVSIALGQTRQVDVSKIFKDPVRPVLVRFNTSLGSFVAVLFETATPKTVANFLTYIRQGQYTGSLIHRSPENFVIQGGGFHPLADRTNADWKQLTTGKPLPNEPGISNSRGTIAMAKLADDQDSATSQWFVSVANNASILDPQNGGFTVFGQVLDDGMDIVDAINALPRADYMVRVQNFYSGTFEDVPGNDVTAPPTLTAAKEVLVTSIEELKPISISIVSNSNPSVASASLFAEQLTLSSAGLGTTGILLRGTDADGATVDFTLNVQVNPPPPPPRDTTKPTVQISAPSSRGKYPSTGKLRVQGSAKDNVGLAKWQYRLNGSSWKSGGTLSGTSKKFAKTVGRFKRGRNKLQLRSFDRAGNVSSTDSKTITLK